MNYNKEQLNEIYNYWDKLSYKDKYSAHVDNYNYRTNILVVGRYTFFFTNKKYLELGLKALKNDNKLLLTKIK